MSLSSRAQAKAWGGESRTASLARAAISSSPAATRQGRSEGPLTQAAEEIAQETGRRVVPFAADSSDLDGCGQLLELVTSVFGRLDILVCNSGGPPPGGVKDLNEYQWAEACQLLVTAPVYLLKNALPLLAKSPAPRFFVVTSSSTVTPVAGLTLSNTFRPAVVGLIKSLTEELASDNVCCHSIAPGRFDTDRLAAVFEMQGKKLGKPPEEMRQTTETAIPAGRLGNPNEMGDLVAYLSSPQASYLRGGNWLMDGGLVRVI